MLQWAVNVWVGLQQTDMLVELPASSRVSD